MFLNHRVNGLQILTTTNHAFQHYVHRIRVRLFKLEGLFEDSAFIFCTIYIFSLASEL